MKRSTCRKLISFSVAWLILIPASILLHNLFSGIYGEFSALSEIFFSMSLIFTLGAFIPIVLLIIACVKWRSSK